MISGSFALLRPFALAAFCVLCLAAAGCSAGDGSRDGVNGTPGVSSSEVVLGSSLALSGHAGYLGTETYRGAMSYINHVNESGGVYGRRIRLIAYDDSYDPPQCLVNTQKLIVEDRVFALFGYVGTPTTVKILPAIESAKIPLLGMLTGANALREPFNKYLFNVRASYYEETSAAVRHLVEDLDIRRIAVFYQYDAYGFDGLRGTELALKRYGLEPVARGSYVRGTLDVEDAYRRIVDSGAEAVVMIGTYGTCSRFIHMAEYDEYSPLFYLVSFVGAEELARNLRAHTRDTIIMSQVVPPPTMSEKAPGEGAVAEYVRLLQKYYPQDTPNFVGMEGYVNARVLVEALRRAGPDLTRADFIKALESLNDYRLGPGLTISFGEWDRQGMDSVYFTRLKGGRFQLMDDWNALESVTGRRPGRVKYGQTGEMSEGEVR